MAAKVSSVGVTGSNKNLGEFKIERFNMFSDDDMTEYAQLRTDANDASRGINIEQIREYTRKTTTREGDGPDCVVTTVEEIFLVVHYWNKKPIESKGDSDADVKEARRDWSKEQSVG
jgi:hypothetical protein